MSEDRWQLLQGLARTRGYDVIVDGDTLALAPRAMLGKDSKVVVFTQALDAAGVESASVWLLGKRRLVDPWPFH